LTRDWEPHPIIDHPHGVLRAVSFDEEAPPEARARLLPEEQAFAASLSPIRRPTWIAGRLALAAALAAIGAPRAALLSTGRGAPLVPRGFVGSVSHKRDLAVAMAARDDGARIGVDVEELVQSPYDVSRRVLTAAELAAVDALPGEARWREVLLRFSIKESIYKAVDPFVRRYVGFKEAEVDPGPWGEGVRSAGARLSLEQGDGSFEVKASWLAIGGHVVTSAVVRPAP
jgi:4'-phosphopantetheinyl transferase EntD